jgi:hypothetical protein
MAYELDQNFQLSEAPHSDIEETFRVMQKAFEKDEVWQVAFPHCDPEELHAWIMAYLAPRWRFPDITIYKITEVSTGYEPIPAVYIHCELGTRHLTHA